MPQLDKVTFYVQYSSMIWFFLFFHYIIKQTLIKTIYVTLKLRELFVACLDQVEGISANVSRSNKYKNINTHDYYLQGYFLLISYFRYFFSKSLKKDHVAIEKTFFLPAFIYLEKKNNKLNLIISKISFKMK